jgi:hypothetical protein
MFSVGVGVGLKPRRLENLRWTNSGRSAARAGLILAMPDIACAYDGCAVAVTVAGAGLRCSSKR